jgi:nucleoside-diphosphate-sugar epimerase
MKHLSKSQPRLLVTGANGFVGKGLVTYIAEKGLEVQQCMRKNNGDAGVGSESLFLHGNLEDKIDWSDALENIDAVVHTAARVHVMNENSSDPLTQYRLINVKATIDLAKQALKAGVKRFIYISSIKVSGEQSEYGKPLEASEVPHPIGDYAVSKYEAEMALQELASETGLEVVIIRPPLVYGPGVKANFYNLAKVIRLGLPLPLASFNNNSRSMVYLDNLTDFTLLCAVSPSAANQIFMVSDGNDVSTADLIRYMASAMSKTVRLIPVPVALIEKLAVICGKQNFIQRLSGSLQVDIQKNYDVLGWRPKVTLEDGLSATLTALNN